MCSNVGERVRESLCVAMLVSMCLVVCSNVGERVRERVCVCSNVGVYVSVAT